MVTVSYKMSFSQAGLVKRALEHYADAKLAEAQALGGKEAREARTEHVAASDLLKLVSA